MFGRMKDPVEGTATVVGYSEHHTQKGSDVVLDAQVIVQAEGLVPTTVDARPQIPQSWMPVKVGTEWPVRVDRAKPERLEFLWERVQGAAPGSAPAPAPAPAPTAPIVTRSVQTFSLPPQIQVMGMGGGMVPEQYKQAIDMAEQATGMDLDGDGKVAGGAAPKGPNPFQAFYQQATAAAAAYQPPAATPPAPAESDDPVARLERLAKLLDSGAITREEFDAQKKRILGEI
jgi:Short C-terminal domain